MKAFVLTAVLCALIVNASALCQHIVTPAYWYPGATWNATVQGAPTANVIIMNPDSGPGRTRDPNYVSGVGIAHDARVTVVGYSHTSYGSRAATQVKAEINSYYTWYNVDGIFLDEVSSDAAHLPYYSDLYQYIHTDRNGTVILNPGTITDAGYMQVGDIVCLFESTFSEYQKYSAPDWTKSQPASKIYHIVYGVNEGDLASVLKKAESFNAGTVYVTQLAGSNPYATLPSYWTEEITDLKSKC